MFDVSSPGLDSAGLDGGAAWPISIKECTFLKEVVFSEADAVFSFVVADAFASENIAKDQEGVSGGSNNAICAKVVWIAFLIPLSWLAIHKHERF